MGLGEPKVESDASHTLRDSYTERQGRLRKGRKKSCTTPGHRQNGNFVGRRPKSFYFGLAQASYRLPMGHDFFQPPSVHWHKISPGVDHEL